MRIDSNQAGQSLRENDRITQLGAARSSAQAPANDPPGEDRAQHSRGHFQIQALASKLLQLPEIRQEKVKALRQLVRDGSYNPRPHDVADAVFAHFVAKAAA